jgi:hypothetical protein
MFFILHPIASILQILGFTLIAGFVLGFLGQEFKLDKAIAADADQKKADSAG